MAGPAGTQMGEGRLVPAAARLGDPRGQGSVELLAILPALILTGLLMLQLGAVGYAYTLIDGAAEAGAVALASGLPAEPAVKRALPGWARDRLSVRAGRHRVEVTLRPPALFDSLADRLRLSSSAAVAPQQGGGGQAR